MWFMPPIGYEPMPRPPPIGPGPVIHGLNIGSIGGFLGRFGMAGACRARGAAVSVLPPPPMLPGRPAGAVAAPGPEPRWVVTVWVDVPAFECGGALCLDNGTMRGGSRLVVGCGSASTTPARAWTTPVIGGITGAALATIRGGSGATATACNGTGSAGFGLSSARAGFGCLVCVRWACGNGSDAATGLPHVHHMKARPASITAAVAAIPRGLE